MEQAQAAALKRRLIRIAPKLAKANDGQTEYMTGWLNGALAMLAREEPKKDEATKGGEKQ